MDTKYTALVLEEAARRLNRIKDEVADRGQAEMAVGAGIVNELGWSLMAVSEMMDDECAGIAEVIPAGDSQMAVAFVDGLMLGALCADIVAERAHGLRLVTP